MRFYTIKLPRPVGAVVRFFLQLFGGEGKKRVVKKVERKK
ncbi:stage V sporulation protein M [Hydrogenibacillus sp. N12]|nr:stage V sporulation protein M [Hydrogenibacillus sp. N12]QZA33998.1 stage V sporulation protein M [Hydrogenibacillus sp. N12]